MSVLQEWVEQLSFMQQSVLMTAVRGPDGLPKNHVSKLMLRWLRRCFLLSAFDKEVLSDPYDPRGGSFTGPSISKLVRACDGHSTAVCDALCCPPLWFVPMNDVLTDYLRHVDEAPHHFHLHLMHAAEILGYKHPDQWIREWWRLAYNRLANDMHLLPEAEDRMDQRLGDSRKDWLAAEEVTAQGPVMR
jgi:hypothetical protein